MRLRRLVLGVFLIIAWWCFVFVASSAAQVTSTGLPKSAVEPKGFTWTETFEGSGNTDGFITDINSTVGYIFNGHFSVDFGIPYSFVQPSTSKTGTTFASGIGNPYTGLTFSQKGGAVNYSTSLNGSIPVSTTAKGLSTGRVTFDWNHHFDHEFDFVTPFLNLGVANSVPDTRYFHRPYISLGSLAHFEAGPEFDIGDKLSVTASGYYILPWGPQKIYERGEKKSGTATTGGPSLTRDGGVNFGVDYELSPMVALSAGYSYSTLLCPEYLFLWHRVQPNVDAQGPPQGINRGREFSADNTVVRALPEIPAWGGMLRRLKGSAETHSNTQEPACYRGSRTVKEACNTRTLNSM